MDSSDLKSEPMPMLELPLPALDRGTSQSTTHVLDIPIIYCSRGPTTVCIPPYITDNLFAFGHKVECFISPELIHAVDWSATWRVGPLGSESRRAHRRDSRALSTRRCCCVSCTQSSM